LSSPQEDGEKKVNQKKEEEREVSILPVLPRVEQFHQRRYQGYWASFKGLCYGMITYIEGLNNQIYNER